MQESKSKKHALDLEDEKPDNPHPVTAENSDEIALSTRTSMHSERGSSAKRAKKEDNPLQLKKPLDFADPFVIAVLLGCAAYSGKNYSPNSDKIFRMIKKDGDGQSRYQHVLLITPSTTRVNAQSNHLEAAIKLEDYVALTTAQKSNIFERLPAQTQGGQEAKSGCWRCFNDESPTLERDLNLLPEQAPIGSLVIIRLTAYSLAHKFLTGEKRAKSEDTLLARSSSVTPTTEQAEIVSETKCTVSTTNNPTDSPNWRQRRQNGHRPEVIARSVTQKSTISIEHDISARATDDDDDLSFGLDPRHASNTTSPIASLALAMCTLSTVAQVPSHPPGNATANAVSSGSASLAASVQPVMPEPIVKGPEWASALPFPTRLILKLTQEAMANEQSQQAEKARSISASAKGSECAASLRANKALPGDAVEFLAEIAAIEDQLPDDTKAMLAQARQRQQEIEAEREVAKENANKAKVALQAFIARQQQQLQQLRQRNGRLDEVLTTSVRTRARENDAPAPQQFPSFTAK